MKSNLVYSALTFLLFTLAEESKAQWNLTGNSNATSTSIFGTTNAIPLNLYTNNINRMTITSAGRIGVGLTTPANIFSIKGSGSIPAASWINSGAPLVTGFGEQTVGNSDYILSMASTFFNARPVFIGRRGRGTLAAPAAVNNNDYLMSFMTSGYDGSDFQNPAGIDFYVDSTPTAGNVPARISFVTGSNSTTRAERLKILSGGDVSVVSGNLNILSANKTIQFANSVYGSPAMMTMFQSGTSNPTRMVIAHSSVNPTSGLQYNDTTDQFDFMANGVSGLSINPTNGTVTANNAFYSPKFSATSTSSSALISSYNNGIGHGVYGYAAGNFIPAPYGISGVYGFNASFGYGVGGYGTSGTGVFGYSYNYSGVWGSNRDTTQYAGFFQGNVFSTGNYTSSDRKLKKDIAEMTGGMDIIDRLKPKTYAFRQDGNYKLMNLPTGIQYGLIAQDLEEVLPGLVKKSEFDPNMVKNAGKNPADETNKTTDEKIDFKAVNYTELIPIIIKALQEQQEKIKTLTELVEKLSSGAKAAVSNVQLSSAALEQNVPNPPLNNMTRINYSVPKSAVKAELIITDNMGKKVKQVTLNNGGRGSLNIDTSGLVAGTYSYTLYVDAKMIETKKMVVVK